MRILIALTFLAAACGGAQTKTESPIVDEGSATSDNCCCKSTSLASEAATPDYAPANRMECSAKQGTCVDDVQCQASAQPE